MKDKKNIKTLSNFGSYIEVLSTVNFKMKDIGMTIEEFAEALKKAKKESRYFRFLLWMDGVKFDIKRIFKKGMRNEKSL